MRRSFFNVMQWFGRSSFCCECKADVRITDDVLQTASCEQQLASSGPWNSMLQTASYCDSSWFLVGLASVGAQQHSCGGQCGRLHP